MDPAIQALGVFLKLQLPSLFLFTVNEVERYWAFSERNPLASLESHATSPSVGDSEEALRVHSTCRVSEEALRVHSTSKSPSPQTRESMIECPNCGKGVRHPWAGYPDQ